MEDNAIDYTALHKKAFRVAFDVVQEYWPPVNDVDYFNRLYAKVIDVVCGELKGNELGKRFMEMVYWYMADMAKVIHAGGEAEC